MLCCFELKEFKTEGFESLLVDLVVCQDESFELVGTNKFVALVDYLRPGTKVISPTTWKRRVMSKFENKKMEIKGISRGTNGRLLQVLH
jgi:hypothetical protein